MNFSIIVPVYNSQTYLEACCHSVLHQTHPDFQLILVDDGSTDESGILCDRICREFPEKCIVIHTPNQGPLLARQTGIRSADGDFLVFLDADDCLRPDALQILDTCIRSTNCHMVLYNASHREDFSGKVQAHPFPHGFSIDEHNRELVYEGLVGSLIPNSLCLKAAARHCAENMPDFAGLSYVRHGEDLLMSLYLITAARKILCLDESLYYYRQREGSIVHSFNPNRAESIKFVHRELERFIDLWELPRLHPGHFAREVRSWVDNMRILMVNKHRMTGHAFRRQLRTLAEDPYFRRAYEKMDPAGLSASCKLLARWLYVGNYSLLHAAACFRDFIHRIKA